MDAVWVVFVGAYSDRRAVAVFDSERVALEAGESLLGEKYIYEDVELERFTVQHDPNLGLNGPEVTLYRSSKEWVREGKE
jgi:hypothetical protein